MEWSDVVAAARAASWVTALATTGADGRPAVGFVSPGFAHERIYAAVRPGTRMARNLATNPHVAMHWPVTEGGTAEVFVRGTAVVRDDPATKEELWGSGGFAVDLGGFFAGPDDPDLVFVEITPIFARTLGADGYRAWRSA